MDSQNNSESPYLITPQNALYCILHAYPNQHTYTPLSFPIARTELQLLKSLLPHHRKTGKYSLSARASKLVTPHYDPAAIYSHFAYRLACWSENPLKGEFEEVVSREELAWWLINYMGEDTPEDGRATAEGSAVARGHGSGG